MNKKYFIIMVTCLLIALIAVGIMIAGGPRDSAAIIGGSDGPTAIFIAGKAAPFIIIAAGLVVLGSLFFFIKKNGK